MKKNNVLNNGIPISISLNPTLEAENFKPQKSQDKKRLFIISLLAFCIAVIISFVAKILVALIDFFTNISFHGNFSFEHSNPANPAYGWIIIFIPAIGGIIVGLMALYGSKAIRGHGIPEAMEQILTNQSKIKPAITYLKPLSAAISIGTGGPFGAEGPIIATGGAFGSTVGQLLKISDNERKIILAAGATAGMAAIFGSPVAAIFLAIELLLFEFSPRSLLPVSIACITGAAGHHFLFGIQPVFAMPAIAPPENSALAIYSCIGIIIGLLATVVTKAVYFIEDCFEKIPLHWMFWPAIGGLIVGIIGYFDSRTFGVGYNNITEILNGNMTVQLLLSLCILKFISWAVALGSGTSGGTLAPLLTIGGAAGALIGMGTIFLFPHAHITIPLAALAGMSAMFAGASRALITSIIFSLETTAQANALLPLLGACIASYFVSFFLMKNTIMTEKIARRGVKSPDSYEPDILEKINVEDVMQPDQILLSEENTVQDIREWLEQEAIDLPEYFAVVTNEGEFKGTINSSNLFSDHQKYQMTIGKLLNQKYVSISALSSLRKAVELMANENISFLTVVLEDNPSRMIGILSYKDVLAAYKTNLAQHRKLEKQISLKRGYLKILLRGQKLIR